MEQPRPALVVLVGLVSVGVALAAVGDFRFQWEGFGMLLASAALAGLRGCLLQRVLHGHEVGLAVQSRRQRVHPLQLIYAMAPWTTGTAALLALLFERNVLSALLTHEAELRSLMVW